MNHADERSGSDAGQGQSARLHFSELRLRQFTAGLYVAGGVYFGIISRSWNAAYFWWGLGAVLMVPSIAAQARQAKQRSLRMLGWIPRCAFWLLGLALLLSVVERVYLVNADSYPRFLVSEDLGNVDAAGLAKLRQGPCKSDPIDVLPKGDVYVLRCGQWWFTGRTYISHTNPLAPVGDAL